MYKNEHHAFLKITNSNYYDLFVENCESGCINFIACWMFKNNKTVDEAVFYFLKPNENPKQHYKMVIKGDHTGSYTIHRY